ncbi:MAG: hypothetical protein QNJ33_11705 [Crocosphaera sp.]|nr:hypothetical protein [Crocosphaera sp.]
MYKLAEFILRPFALVTCQSVNELIVQKTPKNRKEMQNTLALINLVEQIAQSIVATPGLPASAVRLQQNAARFTQDYKPQLVDNVNTIEGFVRRYDTVRSPLQSNLDAWQAGNTNASLEVSKILKELSLVLEEIISRSTDVKDDVTKYGELMLGVQQGFFSETNELRGQIRTAQAQLSSQRAIRDDLIRRRIELASFPVINFIVQIANLIARQRLIEQDIAELSTQLSRFENKVARLNYTLRLAEQLSNRLNILVETIFNLFNALIFTNNSLEQALQQAESGGDVSIAIVAKAYVSSFEEQIKLFS